LLRNLGDSLVLWVKRTTVREYRERTGRFCAQRKLTSLLWSGYRSMGPAPTLHPLGKQTPRHRVRSVRRDLDNADTNLIGVFHDLEVLDYPKSSPSPSQEHTAPQTRACNKSLSNVPWKVAPRAGSLAPSFGVPGARLDTACSPNPAKYSCPSHFAQLVPFLSRVRPHVQLYSPLASATVGSEQKNMRRSHDARVDLSISCARARQHESQITSVKPRIANYESLLTNHHSLITHFLIGFAAIRNRCNQMKTKGRLPF
jgi:hypothetical protein